MNIEKHHLDTVSFKLFIFSLLIIVGVESVFAAILSYQNRLASLEMIGGIRLTEIIGLILLCQRYDNGLSSIGLTYDRVIPGIRRGMIWSVGFGCFVLFVSGILFLAGINVLKMIHMPIPQPLKQKMLFFLLIGCIGPLAEEMVFRGLLYGFLKRWGVFTAVIVSVTVFVLFHGGTRFPVTQMIGGVLFTVSYEIEKNLMVPITIHMSGNLAMSVISLYY